MTSLIKKSPSSIPAPIVAALVKDKDISKIYAAYKAIPARERKIIERGILNVAARAFVALRNAGVVGGRHSD